MKNLFKTIVVLLVLIIVLSAALKIKRYAVTPKEKPPRAVSVQPAQQTVHQNLACVRIQRKEFNQTNTQRLWVRL